MANLRGFIGTSDTTIQVDDTTSLPVNGGVVQIESEKILYTSATASSLLGCTRGALSTSAATHADKKPITNLSDSVPNSGVLDFNAAEAPTNGITGRNAAKKGDRFTNLSTGDVYVNTGSLSAPIWTLLESAAGAGITQLTGDVTAGPGSGSQAATVASVGGSTASNVHSAELAANAATDLNTASKIVKRDASGNFTAGTITASLTGHASLDLPLTGGTLTGKLTQDVAPGYLVLDRQASFDSPISLDGRNIASHVDVNVDAACTVNGPTNGTEGQKITFAFRQTGAGFAVTFATGAGNFAFGTDIPSFTASGAGLTDYVGAIWNPDANRWHIVSVVQGF